MSEDGTATTCGQPLTRAEVIKCEPGQGNPTTRPRADWDAVPKSERRLAYLEHVIADGRLTAEQLAEVKDELSKEQALVVKRRALAKANAARLQK